MDGLEKIKQHFNARPFYDENLSHDLDVLERRKRASALQAKAAVPCSPGEQQHPSGNESIIITGNDGSMRSVSTHRDPTAGYRHFAVTGKFPEENAGKGNASHLPPPIPRPWSVDQLLSRSQMLHGIPRDGRFPRQLNPGADPGVSELVKAEKPERLEQFAKALPEDEYWESSTGDEDDEYRGERKRDGARRSRNGIRGVPSGDDSRFGAQFYASQGALEYPVDTVHTTSGDDGASDADAAFQKRDGRRGLNDDTVMPVPDDLLTAHIERALARKNLQETRLRALGIRAPNSKQSEGVQTIGRDPQDDVILGSQRPRKDRDDAMATGDSHGSGRAAMNDDPSDGPASYVLNPMLPIRNHFKDETLDTNTDTVWQRLLNEEKKIADLPLEEQAKSLLARPSDIPNPWIDILRSSAQARSTQYPGSASTHHRAKAAAAVAAAQQPDTLSKAALLQQIDHMQLDNEEMLIRNRIIRDPLPSSAGGAFSVSGQGRRAPAGADVVQDPNEQMTVDAVAHVAAAHGNASAKLEAMNKFRPTGGYGSASDPNYDPHADPSADDDRWVAAKANLERERLLSSQGGEPLRAWAQNLPTKFLGNLSNEHRGDDITLRTHANSGVAENAARKKWANVTFNQPDHVLSSGVVEGLSQRVRSSMYPQEQ